MFSIAWPWMLALLPLPIVTYLFVPPFRSSQSALRVPFYEPISKIAEDRLQSSSAFRLICMTLIWIFLVLASARPQWIGEPQSIPVTGRDLMLAVDISESMKAEDMEIEGQLVDRLTAVKSVASKFIEQRVGDRIGLILFGSQAYLQTPLSFDRETVNTLLQESAIGIAGKKTAIGDAVGLALKRIRSDSDGDGDRKGEKVLVLLTDGANTAGAIEPLKAAELAQSAGLKIYTIGVGADQIIVNSVFGQRMVNPSSDLDEETLTTMAQITGGKYFRARDGESLNEIYDLIDELEPVEDDSRYLRPIDELYYLPLGIAALLSMMTALVILMAPGVKFGQIFLTPKTGAN